MYVDFDRDDVKLLRHIFERFDKIIGIDVSADGSFSVTPEFYTTDKENFKYHFKFNGEEIEEEKIKWVWV